MLKDLILPWDGEGINYDNHNVHLICHHVTYKIDLEAAKESLNSKGVGTLVKIGDQMYKVRDISKDDKGRLEVTLDEIIFMA